MNYTLAAAFGRTSNTKGGVAIYKNNKLRNKIVNLEVDNFSIPLICEMSAVKLYISKKNTINILGVYCPPSRSIDNTKQGLDVIEDVLSVLTSGNTSTLIIGDININDLELSKNKEMFDGLLASFGINRVHLPATRTAPSNSKLWSDDPSPQHGRVSATSIDAVCTNMNLDQIKVQIINTGISDHTGQLCSLNVPATFSKPVTSTRRHINLNSLNLLKSLLSEESWISVLSSNNVNDAYDIFINVVTCALDFACPQKKYRIN